MKRAVRTRPKCACGCGNYVFLNNKGTRYNIYIHGHNGRGENNINFGKFGIEHPHYLNGKNEKKKQWKEAVKERDNYTCQKCGKILKKGDKLLDAHHIKSKEEYPELRFDVDNGLTLCHECHTALHNTNASKETRKKWSNSMLKNNKGFRYIDLEILK